MKLRNLKIYFLLFLLLLLLLFSVAIFFEITDSEAAEFILKVRLHPVVFILKVFAK